MTKHKVCFNVNKQLFILTSHGNPVVMYKGTHWDRVGYSSTGNMTSVQN